MRARLLSRIVVETLLLLALLIAGGGAARVVVTPARIEVEVTPQGSQAVLSLYNRGEQRVMLSLFTGMGSHGADGSPVFFDDAEAREESSRLVGLARSQVILDEGAAESVRVDLLPAAGRVAAYPVIFVDFIGIQPVEQAARVDAPAVRSVARLAVPVLLTYHTTRQERRRGFQIEEVRAQPAPDFANLDVAVTVRNVGNVHDWVRGRVNLLGSDGAHWGEVLLPERRVLPGAVRILRAKAMLTEPGLLQPGFTESGLLEPGIAELGVTEPSLTESDRIEPGLKPGLSGPGDSDDLRLVAEVYGDGWSSVPAPYTLAMTLTRPTELVLADRAEGAGEETAQ